MPFYEHFIILVLRIAILKLALVGRQMKVAVKDSMTFDPYSSLSSGLFCFNTYI